MCTSVQVLWCISAVLFAAAAEENSSFILATVLCFKDAKGDVSVARGPISKVYEEAVRAEISATIQGASIKVVPVFNESIVSRRTDEMIHLIKEKYDTVFVTHVTKRNFFTDLWDRTTNFFKPRSNSQPAPVSNNVDSEKNPDFTNRATSDVRRQDDFNNSETWSLLTTTNSSFVETTTLPSSTTPMVTSTATPVTVTTPTTSTTPITTTTPASAVSVAMVTSVSFDNFTTVIKDNSTADIATTSSHIEISTPSALSSTSKRRKLKKKRILNSFEDFEPNSIFYAVEKKCVNWADDCNSQSSSILAQGSDSIILRKRKKPTFYSMFP